MRHLLAVLVFVGCTETAVDVEPIPEEEEEPVMPEAPDPTPMPEQPDAVIARWQQCMTFPDFQAANMTAAWNSVTAQNGMKCASCHAAGGNGFITTTDAQVFFDALKTNRYLLLQFVTLAATAQGGYQVIVNETTIPAVGRADTPHGLHPKFDPTAGMAATRDFYTRTNARCAQL